MVADYQGGKHQGRMKRTALTWSHNQFGSTSGSGTKLSNRNVRLPVANGGKADIQPAIAGQSRGKGFVQRHRPCLPHTARTVVSRELTALGPGLGSNNRFALVRRKNWCCGRVRSRTMARCDSPIDTLGDVHYMCSQSRRLRGASAEASYEVGRDAAPACGARNHVPGRHSGHRWTLMDRDARLLIFLIYSRKLKGRA